MGRLHTFLFFVFAVVTTYASATLDIALIEFFLSTGNKLTAAQSAPAVFDKGEELLRTNYGSFMNVTGSRFYREDVTNCIDMAPKALNWAARYYYTQTTGNPVLAMLGPECAVAATSLASLATEWKIPMLMPNPGDPAFSNKRRYPTLTRISPFLPDDVNQVLYKILSGFGYDTVGILCDDTDDSGRTGRSPASSFVVPMCTSVFDTLRLNYNLSVSRFYITGNDRRNTMHYLEEIRSIARVVVIIAHGSRIRPIMLAASDAQMTNGDYVYFAFEPFRSPEMVGNITWRSDSSDGRDEDARTAFRSLFKISTRPEESPEYRNFTKELKRLTKEKYSYEYATGEEVNPFTMAYYYALSIYGQVLSEMATSGVGGNPRDGVEVSKRMRNRTFTILGQDIFINANGDRESDWVLSQPDDNGNFKPVMEYSARQRVLQPSRDPVDNSTRQIVWPNKRNSPPLNEPLCGYRGTKCVSGGGGDRNAFRVVVADVLQGTASRQQDSPIQSALNSTVNLIQQFSSVLNQYRSIFHI
ncbi:atrial natriuretic peptide receptor 1-like [Paramacrobiotus metropolitanus]|uniref:atrial natriuretic peptide receptor 1-like n=1 Tax=Paramacrobiotus metropolitanus TaxID=2943436 RepID=UPI0024457E60|nr:atrial natriuretic peptide receptor 1-like [Paramacrobiotus metropolitanus]